MKRILLIAVLLSMFISGCEVKNKSMKVYLRSYIMGYYDPFEIQLNDIGWTDYGNNIYVFVTKGETIGTYMDDGERKILYDKLCEKHGDMTFNRVIDYHPWAGILEYPGVDFVSIEVTSNADYDVAHLAGDSLTDIVIGNMTSVKEYIESGYTKYDSKNGSYAFSYVTKNSRKLCPMTCC